MAPKKRKSQAGEETLRPPKIARKKKPNSTVDGNQLEPVPEDRSLGTSAPTGSAHESSAAANAATDPAGNSATDPSDSNAASGYVPADLQAIPIPLSHQTRNLNRWTKEVDGARLIVKPRPFTPESVEAAIINEHAAEEEKKYRRHLIASTLEPVNIHEGEVQDNRNFQIHHVEQCTDANPHYWSMFIQDHSHPSRPILQLFGRVRGPKTTVGLLDVSTCSDEAAAKAVAERACAIINRFPADIDIEGWSKVSNYATSSMQRTVVETLAIEHWRPGFDWSGLRKNMEAADLGRGASNAYGLGSLLHSVSAKRVELRMRPVLQGAPRGGEVRVVMSLNDLKFEQLSKLPTFPQTVAGGLSNFEQLEKLDATDEQKAACRNLFQYLEHKTIGKMFGLRQYVQFVDSLLRPYWTKRSIAPVLDEKWADNKRSQISKGPFGGEPFYQQPAPQTRGDFVPIRANTAASNACGFSLIAISVHGDSKARVAYVLSRMAQQLEEGGNIAQAYLEGGIAADQLYLSLVTIEEVLGGLAASRDDNFDAKVRSCRICWRLRLGKNMVILEDGRVVCMECDPDLTDPERQSVLQSAQRSREDAQRPRTRRERQTLMRSLVPAFETTFQTAYNAIRSESGSDPRNALVTKLLEASDRNSNEWIDAFDGHRPFPSRVSAISSTGRTRLRKDPFQPSMDALYPLVRVDGQLAYHELSNMVVTTLYSNLHKGNAPAALFAVHRAAAERTILENKGVLPRDPGFWASIHNAQDHIHLLTVAFPHAKKHRFSTATATDTDLAAIHEAWRAGEWTAELPVIRKTRKTNLLLTSACFGGSHSLEQTIKSRKSARLAMLSEVELDLANEAIRARCQKWSTVYRRQLLRIVNDIESDVALNPKGLKIPRGNDDAPWPFRIEHMLSEEADLWEWWYYECVSRYFTLSDWCNWAHETKESPATLFLIIVIQWFQREGGIDSFIHCEMTFWCRHPARYSIGRAGHVQPGSPMRTGFSKQMPTRLTDFVAEDCTVVIQPHFLNQMWSGFDLATHPAILDDLANTVGPSSQHYGPFKADLAPIQYPKKSLISRRAKGTAEKTADIAHDETVDELQDEENDDDQILPGDRISEQSSSAQARSAEEQARLVTQLRGRLNTLRRGASKANLSEDQQNEVDGLMTQMEQAAASANKTAFDTSEKRLDQALQRRNFPRCQKCGSAEAPDDMLACASGHDPPVRIHWFCAGRTSIADDTDPIYCKDCAARVDRSFDVDLPKNMPNVMSSTCYISGSTQILFHLDPVRSIVLDLTRPCKPTDQSGRNPTRWLTSGYAPEVGVKLDSAAKAKADRENMANHEQNAAALAQKLKTFFNRLGQTGANSTPISKPEVKAFAEAITKFDSEFELVSNDASALLGALVDCLVLVTDDSTTDGRDRVDSVSQSINELAPLREYCTAFFQAWLDEGRLSEVTKIFGSQAVVERDCSTCGGVVRLVEHQLMLQLTMPPESAQDTFNLTDILAEWSTQFQDAPLSCPNGFADHPPSWMRYRRLTVTPPVLVLTFHRKDFGDTMRLEHIEIPEFLDVSRIGDNVKLPSERNDHRSFGNKNIYRLAAVDMYYDGPRHYIPFLALGHRWVCLDDLQSPRGVQAKHPQAAITKDGGIPFYVVYMREEGRAELPVDESGRKTNGFLLTKTGSDPGPQIMAYDGQTAQQSRCPGCEGHQCGALFSSQADADAHVKNIIERRGRASATCERCNQTFPSHDALHQHQCPQAQIICADCEQTFASQQLLEDHMCAMETAEKHRCSTCNETFATAEALAGHHTAAHRQLCSLCNERFDTAEGLASHYAAAHGGPGGEEAAMQRKLEAVSEKAEAAAVRRTEEIWKAHEERMRQSEAAHEERLRAIEQKIVDVEKRLEVKLVEGAQQQDALIRERIVEGTRDAFSRLAGDMDSELQRMRQ